MKKTIIFIDTNKYLDFYRASDHSLKMLDVLIGLIEKGEIELILPRQVISEFVRDKDNVFKEFVDKNLRDVKVPGFMDKKRIEKVNKLLSQIREDYKRKLYGSRSKINIKIKKIFYLSRKPEEINEILEKAYYRTLRGNPPRKNNNSFGDAIIWETLLRDFSNYDLTIISGDGDWSSEINKKEIHPFLNEEWNQRKDKKIKLFDTLGEFINIVSKKEKIEKEAIREEKDLNVLASQINTIYSDPSFSNMRDTGVSNIFGSARIGVADNLSASILHNNICSSCNKVFEYDISSIGLKYQDKCLDCRNKTITGVDVSATEFKKCCECGESYCEGLVLGSASGNKCSKCRNKEHGFI